jgi:outer membrane receptor for ferric coprogen and ferric-rhodotorulic acid
VELEVSGEFAKGWQGTAGFNQLSIEGNDGQDVKTYVPRRTLRLSTTYQVAQLPALKVGANLSAQSKISINDGTYTIRQGGYATVGLMARYDIDKHLALSVNLNNVTDKKYLTSLYWTQGYYAAPRSASATLSWKY